MTLRFLTSGESHGRGSLITVEGLPSHLKIDRSIVERELARRRRGWGRGPRMKIERDVLTFWGGLRDGYTTGAPLGIVLENSEWTQWDPVMNCESTSSEASVERSVTCARPGHADLTGAIKYDHRDMRNVLERASARVTASWTIAGTVARAVLSSLGCSVRSCVTSIGGVSASLPLDEEGWYTACNDDLGCHDEMEKVRLIERIKEAQEEGDSLGGTFTISVKNIPPGIGSYVEWDRKLDGRLTQSLMSIPAIKGVEIGIGFRSSEMAGSFVHDEIAFEGNLPKRFSNRAGGIEGGMSNGEDILISASMKPIPTLKKPLRSIDIERNCNREAHFERSDTCAVSAAAVVGEAMVSWVLASAMVEQFGGDTLEELQERFKKYTERTEAFFHDRQGQ